MKLRLLISLLILPVLPPLPVCRAAPEAPAQNRSTARQVAFLQSLRPGATLAQIRKRLPPGTHLGKPILKSYNPNAWNVVRLSGALSGQLIFYNNRAEKLAGLRPDDPLHGVELFLGRERTDWNIKQVRTETEQRIRALSRYLGRPSKRRYAGLDDPFAPGGWSAEWRLPGQRRVTFGEELPYLSGDTIPMLTLTFKYSNLYKS